MSPILFDEVDWERLNKAFTHLFGQVSEYWKAMSKVMETWFPIFSDLHRMEAKRVHTAYRRRQKARKRRKR